MPYVEQVDSEGNRVNVVEQKIYIKKSFMTIPSSLRLIHTNKLLRTPSLLPIISNLQDLPYKYKPINNGKNKEIRDVTVERLIIGGGTSGLASMRENSLLITREELGDILFDEYTLERSFIIEELKKLYKYYQNHIISGRFLGKFDEGLVFDTVDQILIVKANEIVLAGGGRCLKPIFPGNNTPGIVSREFYLKRLKNKFQKILVLGYTDLAARTALHAKKSTILVPNNITISLSPYYKEQLDKKGVEISNGNIYNIESNNGKLIVQTDKTTLEADLIVFSVSKQPRLEITSSVGIGYIYDAGRHLYVPVHDQLGRNKNLFIVGGMRGIDNEYLSYLSGKASKGEEIDRFLEELKKYNPNQQNESPYNYGNGGIVCECEDISMEDINFALSLGIEKDVEKLKRITGLGTGHCQGKACTINLGDYLKSSRLISYRSPIYPVIL